MWKAGTGQDNNTRDHLAPPPQDHCIRPPVTWGGVPPGPVLGPSQVWGLLSARSTALRMQTHSVLQVGAAYGLPFRICKTGQRLARLPPGADAGHLRTQVLPAHPAQAQFMALSQSHGSVGARAGLAHWHHGQRCQARPRKPGAQQSPGCLSTTTGRCQPQARKSMSSWGWQPHSVGRGPRDLERWTRDLERWMPGYKCPV